MWYNSVKAYNGKTVEIFINPDASELPKNNMGIRGIIDKDGNIFLWNGEMLHDHIRVPREKWLIMATWFAPNLYWQVEIRNYASPVDREMISNNPNLKKFFQNYRLTFY